MLPAGYQTTDTFTQLAEAHKMGGTDFSSVNHVIDLLYTLTGQQWDTLVNTFSSVGDVLKTPVDAIMQMQNFLGLNISYTPWQAICNFLGIDGNPKTTSLGVAIVALLIPLVAGGCQWYSTKLMMANQPKQESSEDNPAAGMMKSMNIYMPLMSVFLGFTFASGIGIYWVAQSAFTIIQQIGINSYLKKVDMDDLVQKNIERANKKRAKKGLPPTKVGNVDEMLKEIEEKESKEESARMAKIAKTKVQVEESNKYYNDNAKPGSLAAKANMVAKYNEKHEKGNKK